MPINELWVSEADVQIGSGRVRLNLLFQSQNSEYVLILNVSLSIKLKSELLAVHGKNLQVSCVKFFMNVKF